MASKCAQSLIRHQAFSLGRTPQQAAGLFTKALAYEIVSMGVVQAPEGR
jgi:hypothetical protein